MITIKDFMETVNYRITEGSEYCWSCYGYNAYSLDSWNGDNDNGYSIGIVFDTQTQVVYQMEAHDYKNQRAYRWVQPKFKVNFQNESEEKIGDYNEAYDGVKFVDLELSTDILEKAKAIVNGVAYDTRVTVPIDIPDNELLLLFTMAHERDITLNQLVEEIILEVIEKQGIKK